MSAFTKYINQLTNIFKTAPNKHEANYRSNEIMVEMSADKVFFSEVLQRHLNTPQSLNKTHYPVVGLNIDSNPYFTLLANCWIPLPNYSTDISTKSIHHHGDMLLTSVTAFGTGYEHWTFDTPKLADSANEIYSLKLLEKSLHSLHNVSFVDAYIAHLPLYPPDMTITYALWSSRFPTSWKDYVKRISFFQDNSQKLRFLIAKFGLAKKLELKMVDYFDFYPTCDGFRGIQERKEFDHGPNEDYLASLFNIIQETNNDNLAPLIENKLNSGEKISDINYVKKLLHDLKSGNRIKGRLSKTHYNIPKANFSKDEIVKALAAQKNI